MFLHIDDVHVKGHHKLESIPFLLYEVFISRFRGANTLLRTSITNFHSVFISVRLIILQVKDKMAHIEGADVICHMIDHFLT